MRALIVTAVVGALALSGCQNMEYDKVTLQDKNELDENNVQLSLTLLRSLEN